MEIEHGKGDEIILKLNLIGFYFHLNYLQANLPLSKASKLYASYIRTYI